MWKYLIGAGLGVVAGVLSHRFYRVKSAERAALGVAEATVEAGQAGIAAVSGLAGGVAGIVGALGNRIGSMLD